jgi:hypothetical protein
MRSEQRLRRRRSTRECAGAADNFAPRPGPSVSRWLPHARPACRSGTRSSRCSHPRPSASRSGLRRASPALIRPFGAPSSQQAGRREDPLPPPRFPSPRRQAGEGTSPYRLRLQRCAGGGHRQLVRAPPSPCGRVGPRSGPGRAAGGAADGGRRFDTLPRRTAALARGGPLRPAPPATSPARGEAIFHLGTSPYSSPHPSTDPGNRLSQSYSKWALKRV